MFNIKLVLEYDGTNFHGWQEQPGLRTIQGELQRVLELVLRTEVLRLTASGRTDAGVHAHAQVVNFLIEGQAPDLHRLRHSVSHLLNGELSVIEAHLVPEDFDARRDAERKQYSYHILNRAVPAVLNRGKAWHVSSALDIALMQQQAAALVGEHDFTSVRAAGCAAKTPIRTIFESELTASGDQVVYRVVGSGFLKQMVRNIVGTLVGMGRGELWTTSMQQVLDARDRTRAGITAPPYGLFLDWVGY